MLFGIYDSNFGYICFFVFRCNGIVGHCKIYQNNNGCYGFTEGNLDKSSLVELVDHYSRESLKEHNPTLDIRLLYPVFEGHDDNAGVYLHMQHD